MEEESGKQQTAGVDYALVLEDLKARRKTLDSMIAMVEQFIAQPGSAVPTVPSEQRDQVEANTGPGFASPQDIQGDSFFGMNIPDAIRAFLRGARKKKSVREIADALERGGIQHTSADFYKTVNATLHRIWGSSGEVVKVGKEWGLQEWYPGRNLSKPSKKSGEDKTK